VNTNGDNPCVNNRVPLAVRDFAENIIIITKTKLHDVIIYIYIIQGSGIPLYESAFCAMLDKNVPTGVPVYELSSLLFFLVPMMIIIVLYVLIGLQIRQSSRHSLGKQMQGNVHGETKQIQSKKSIVRMLGNYISL